MNRIYIPLLESLSNSGGNEQTRYLKETWFVNRYRSIRRQNGPATRLPGRSLQGKRDQRNA
ncbi:MAG: hypothetical protein R2838_10395 [Caldilineaceae bacterium]